MRKSISTAFFSMVSTLMVLGIVLMGCSEWVLFKNYFAKDRYETLDQVVNVAKRTAEYLVNSETMPQGAELDALNTKLEIIGESAEAYLFFTDNDGNVMLASDPDMLNDAVVDIDFRTSANAAPDPDGGEGAAKEERILTLDYWPDPCTLEMTDPALRRQEIFPLTDEGRAAAASCLEDAFNADPERWTNCPDMMDCDPWTPPAPEPEEEAETRNA